MFYELNTLDPLGNSPWKRTNDDPLNGTFQGDTNVFAQIVEVVDTGVQFAQQDDIGDADATAENDLTVNSTRLDALESADVGIQIPNLLPDG
jgi:hypothetical protein